MLIIHLPCRTQPYDATEQEVQKVFEVAGPVKSFRHVFDRDNNKAKGFGELVY
jgi:RNA recognition motif-containing protein